MNRWVDRATNGKIRRLPCRKTEENTPNTQSSSLSGRTFLKNIFSYFSSTHLRNAGKRLLQLRRSLPAIMWTLFFSFFQVQVLENGKDFIHYIFVCLESQTAQEECEGRGEGTANRSLRSFTLVQKRFFKYLMPWAAPAAHSQSASESNRFYPSVVLVRANLTFFLHHCSRLLPGSRQRDHLKT